MDSITLVFAIIVGFIVQLVLLHSIIRDATHSKETKKSLDAICKLMTETARKQGVENSTIDKILEEMKNKK